jgi:hypothetical protein
MVQPSVQQQFAGAVDDARLYVAGETVRTAKVFAQRQGLETTLNVVKLWYHPLIDENYWSSTFIACFFGCPIAIVPYPGSCETLRAAESSTFIACFFGCPTAIVPYPGSCETLCDALQTTGVATRSYLIVPQSYSGSSSTNTQGISGTKIASCFQSQLLQNVADALPR